MGSSSLCEESPVYPSQLHRQLAVSLSPDAKLLIKRYGFLSENNDKIKALSNCNQIHLKRYYFIGGMNRGKFNGPGILLTSNGLLYEGDFSGGKFQGKGRIITPKGNMYIGEFQDGLFNNQGVYQTIGGVIIQAFWKNGKPEGAGRQVYPDGLEFRGTFQQGQKVSLGKLRWQKNRHFEGNFFLGKVTGKGVYKEEGFSYEGDWQDSWIHGRGLACKGISCYKGDLSYNCKDGRGQLQVQGAVISGQWEDDRLESGFLQLL